MKKSQLLFFVFFLNVGVFFIKNDAICQTPDDPAIVGEIENKLNKYKKDFETLEKSIVEISDINDNLKTDIKKINDKFENYTKIYFQTIENNENLENAYDKCVDLQVKIDSKIKDLVEGGVKEEKKSELIDKLNNYLSDYEKLKQQGDLFVKNKNRDSLKVLKEGEPFIQLNSKVEALCNENEDLIKKETDLKKLCDSNKQSKDYINKLYIEPKTDIWGIIIKIAIIFALIFFVIMIYNVMKSKKMLKVVKKQNDTPEI